MLYTRTTISILLALSLTSTINSFPEILFRNITIFRSQENSFAEENLLNVFAAANLDHKQFLKNHSFLLMFHQKQNDNLDPIQLLSDLRHYFMYAEIFGIYLGQINCSKHELDICLGKHSKHLYFYHNGSELIEFDMEHYENNHMTDFFESLRLTLPDTVRTIYSKEDENEYFMERLDRNQKVPFLTAFVDEFSSDELSILELGSHLKFYFYIGMSGQGYRVIDNRITVYDPRKCTYENISGCVVWEFDSTVLSDYKPLELTCSVILAYWNNQTIIDARNSEGNNISLSVKLVLKLCPYIVVVTEEDSDKLSIMDNLNKTLRGKRGSAIVRLNKEQMFNLKNDLDNDSLNTPVHFYTIVSDILTPFIPDTDSFDANDVINFVLDEISKVSLFVNNPRRNDVFIPDSFTEVNIPFYADVDEFSKLHLKHNFDLIKKRDLFVKDLKQLQAKFDVFEIVGVLYYQAWDFVSRAVFDYVIEAMDLYSRSLSTKTCLSDSSLHCTKPTNKSVAIFMTDCYDFNLVCNHFNITIYPTLLFFKKTASGGMELFLNYTETLSIKNVYRTLQLLKYSLETDYEFADMLEKIYSFKFTDRVFLGVDLNANEKANDLFQRLSDIYAGRELFLSTDSKNLPKEFLTDKNGNQLKFPAVLSVKLFPHFQISVLETDSLTQDEFPSILKSLNHDGLIPLSELSASDVLKSEKLILTLFSRELTPHLRQTMVNFAAQARDILSTWSDMDVEFHKRLFYDYGCKKTPCVVLNDVKNKSTYVFESRELTVESILGWVSKINENKLQPRYKYKNLKFGPTGSAIDVTEKIYGPIKPFDVDMDMDMDHTF